MYLVFTPSDTLKERGIMKQIFSLDLSLFGESDMGGKEMPELTRQATGEIVEAPAAEENSEEARRTAFRGMMEGEYKDLFQAFFQETFNRRFKEQKSMMEELERARDVVAAAAAHYGTQDTGELAAAIRAEQEKTAPTEAVTGSPEAEETISRIGMEERIKEAVDAAVERARKETERAVTESIRARGLRPAESALAPGVSGHFGNSAARLSRAERAEMARRAAKGERIEF